MITETLTAGGAEIFAVRLCNALCRRHEVVLVDLHPELAQTELRSSLDERVRLISLHWKMYRCLSKIDSLFSRIGIDISLFRYLTIKRLSRIIQEIEPEVIHSHLFKADYISFRAREQAGSSARHVITMHGDYPEFLKGSTRSHWKDTRKKIGAVLGSLDDIVLLAAAQRQFFEEQFDLLKANIHHIYNGFSYQGSEVRSRTELGLPASGFLIGMVSRGVEKKGWQKAVQAFEKLNASGAYLVLVGRGAYLDKLANEITRPDIIFAGYTPDTIQYINHFDLCLLPTLFPHESLPTVILEYLFCHKPVIATAVGEIPAMLESPQTGELAGDRLELARGMIREGDLAELMRRYLNDPSYLSHKKKLAGLAFDKFRMDRCVERYELVYQEKWNKAG